MTEPSQPGISQRRSVSPVDRIFDVIRYAAHMPVLHITYKYDPERSEADYGFCKVIKSYPCKRLSDSNWVINSDEPALYGRNSNATLTRMTIW